MLPKQVVKLRHSIIARIHNLNLLQSISQYIRQLQLFTFYFHILQIKFYTLFFLICYQQLVKRFVEHGNEQLLKFLCML